MSNFALPMDLPNFSAAVKDSKSEFAPARLAAVVSLGVVDSDNVSMAIDTLVPLLSDPVEEIRVQTIDSLASLTQRGGKVDAERIWPLLEDPNTNIRCVTIEMLHIFFDVPLEAALQASKDADAAVRLSAVLLLSNIENDGAISRLEEMVHDTDREVSEQAALQLGAALTDAARVLLESIVLKRQQASRSALISLSKAQPTMRSAEIVQQVAHGRFFSSTLKTAAAAALLEWGQQDGRTIVKQVLGSWRKSKRMAMIQTLAEMSSEHVADVLYEFICSTNRNDEASASIQALAQCAYANHGVHRKLETLLTQLDEPLRSEVSDILTHMENP
ncbi:MAG: HEAT repeat domain-containing protein [Deltaproteobacteria bacterium]|nr:HEAT repeat domain-containing protein [Deltaproteobacteria bacterium]MBN2673720.1 HEAT repeat domain-containing protein [Deltaproteobacteria bacterium]